MVDDDGRRVHERVGAAEAILGDGVVLLLERVVSFARELARRRAIGIGRRRSGDGRATQRNEQHEHEAERRSHGLL